MEEPNSYDVIVIGAGVSGCATARELSRTTASVMVLEAEDDICSGTSKANSAIVHAGYDAQPGTLMAKLNVEGNSLMFELAKKLDFPCKRIGSLVVCTNEADRPGLLELLERGRKNGVPDLRIVERDELRQMEPNVSDDAVAALWAPTAGIVNPFDLTAALAENAAANGVKFTFNAPVTNIEKNEDGTFELQTTRGMFHARCVVNAAGVYADLVHNAVSPESDQMKIVPRRGQYLLLDTTAGAHVKHVVFALPTKMGKGVLVAPTTHGNLIVGPTAEDIDDRQGTDTTAAGLAEVATKCGITVKDVPLREVITSFSGLRAHRAEHEFLIGENPAVPGFVDCAAIESPGLTASPAIGRMVAGIAARIVGAEERPAEDIVETRRGIPNLDEAGLEEWAKLCEKDPRYGHVICRCCHVSEAQIVDAIHRVPGARSLDGVKRRTAAQMGRCQGGFCTPKIMEILSRELDDVQMETVTKCGPGSTLIVGTPKDSLGGDAK
ncbi:MAG: NAD(P)/FAD-dependent oxidoreductase [Tractidigestivibacter sp.]|jgi:glycerol-3-phosphate dehydrogenase|uniref:NAD(P)/FAD-dependent oxidoreductase n=1 Tax=Tractidigestivibacter sp. TaxID=2847320 RepID=UPI003D921B4E